MTRDERIVGEVSPVIDVQYSGLYRGLYSSVGHLSIVAVLFRVLQAIRKTISSEIKV